MKVVLLAICLYNLAPAQINTAEYIASSEYPIFPQRKDQLPRQHVPTSSPLCCQWTTPVIIDTSSPSLQAQIHAVLAVDDSGNLVSAWTDIRRDGANQIAVERSTNKGQTWIRSVPYNYAYTRIVRDMAFDRAGNLWLLWTSLAGEFQPYFLNLSKSTDNGQTFTTLFTSREYAGGFFESKLAIDRSNNVFILWDDQQFKSTRFVNGNISQRTDTPIPHDTLRIDFWCSLALDNQDGVYCVWAGARTPGGRLSVFCSTSRDTGASFIRSVNVDTSQLGQRYPTAAVNDAGIVFAAYMRSPTSVARAGIAVARSLDSGFSFRTAISIVDSGDNGLPVACGDASNGLNLLWSGDGAAYFSRSTDTGQTFSQPQLIVAGRPDMVADHIGNLFAVFETQLRIQFARTNVLVEVKEEKHFPSAIELEQNFPNPFNPNTSFAFSIPSSSQVKLSIFDILGREVEQILNSRYAAGRYQASWAPRDISSGVYFYRLEVRDDRERVSSVTRKLIYIR